MTSTEPGPQVVALSRALARTERKLTDLDKHVRQLAADLLRVTEALIPPAEPDAGADGEVAGPPEVRSWLLATDAEQAAADLADLVEWVGRVYMRYTHAQLSSCWLWHPEVIEELWWLRCAHADAYDLENGSWLRVGDWHDRQRTGVERRVNALLGKCALSRHIERNGRPADVTEPAPPPLAGHHAAVASAWASTHTAGPAPTDDLIREADREEHARHRINR